MKAAVPWSVKGIDPQYREVAKDAARRSGMTLGEWLKSAINEQAEGKEPEMPVSRPLRASYGRPEDSFARATSKLEDIAAQLAKLAQRDVAAPQGYGIYSPDARQQDGEQITRILSRIEANERQSVEAFTAVNERLGTMGRQFAQVAKAATTFKPEEHPSFQALEKAVRNIVEHLESSEKRTRDNLKSLQDRVSDMSTRAAGAPNEQVLRQVPAFTQLEQKLGDLSRRIEASEKTPQTSLPELLGKELKELAGRIDIVRETAESLATKAQTQAVLTSQKELRAIEDRLQGVLREAQQTFTRGTATEGEIQKIRADVEALNKRIDSTRQGTASDRDVHALRVAVEQLSTRVAQGPDLRPLADMDRRIVELAKRINETPQPDFSQFGELEGRINELDQRLTHVMSSGPNQDANEALSQQIAAVAERMDRAEQQLGHMDAIERAINQLYDGLEQTRNMTQQVAEEAATRAAHKAAQQFVAQIPQPVAAPTAEIHALEQGLEAVRAAAETSDQRNQDTLMALHETLEHIVGKLSELETATIGQRIAVAAGVATSVVAEAPARNFAPPITEAEVPAADPRLPESPFQEPVFQEPRLEEQTPSRAAEIHPAFASDTISTAAYQDIGSVPEEPASERVAEPQIPSFTSAAAVPAKLQDEETVDLIAAARRAQQAAAHAKGSFPGFTGRKSGASASSGSLLGKLTARFKRGEKPEPRTAAEELRVRSSFAGEAAAPGQDKSRKKLLYVGLLILAAAAAIFMTTSSKSIKPAKVTEWLEPYLGKLPSMPSVLAEDKSSAPAAATPGADIATANTPTLAEETESNAVAKSAPPAADEILTGAITPAKPLESIIAGNAAPIEGDLPPEQIGSHKLRSAAASGNANAQFIVASRYMDGEHVDRDFAKAAEWYGKSAAAGFAPAQYRIATLYERGKGVDKDVKTALEWYEKAAELGNVRSMHNAAVIYAGADAGKPDYAKAFKWFSLAASHGLKDSQFNLAILFERGLGVKPDPAQAMFWYLAAARQNDTDAQQRADVIAKSLDPAQAAKIKTKSKDWMPETAPDIANSVQINDADWQDSTG